MNIKAQPITENFVPKAFSAGKYVLCTHKDGRATIKTADENLNLETSFSIDFAKDDVVTAAFNKACVAVIHQGKSLEIYDFNGKLVKSFAGAIEAAAFDRQNRLWMVSREDKENLEITVLDDSFEVIASIDCADEFYDSSVMLKEMPQFNCIYMDLLAGQDGCQTYTIQLDGDEITVETEFEGDLTCQAFTEDNKHFLAISNGDDIFQYWAFPGEMIHELDIEDIIDEDEEYNMGYTLFHIKGKLFVINFTERYYIYDADKNEIVDELIVDGHEPRPTHEIYPSLDDDTLITDIEYMDEVHDIIVLHTTRAKNREVSYFRKADLAKLF